MAKLYSDENFRYAVVERLRALGHDVLTVQEAYQRGVCWGSGLGRVSGDHHDEIDEGRGTWAQFPSNSEQECIAVTMTHSRTVWFPKDSLLVIILLIPYCAIGSVVWALSVGLSLVAFSNGVGSLDVFMLFSLLVGAAYWFCFSIYLIFACREISTGIPLRDASTLPARLVEITKPLRYTVEQLSPMSFVCGSKRGLARFYSFEYSKLHVVWNDGHAVLTGPATIVNNVGKKLLADSRTDSNRGSLNETPS